jgi:hypothetical protein
VAERCLVRVDLRRPAHDVALRRSHAELPGVCSSLAVSTPSPTIVVPISVPKLESNARVQNPAPRRGVASR